MPLWFVLNAVLFGVGLAMDAFSVSLANGLAKPGMPVRERLETAGVFGAFQTLMPLLGYACVHWLAERFHVFHQYTPWIALILLTVIGGNMIREGLSPSPATDEGAPLRFAALLIQGIATSIDALSVGFTIADLRWQEALAESAIIGTVTFGICMAGIELGRRAATRLSDRAKVLGGGILIAIGLEILLKHLLAG